MGKLILLILVAVVPYMVNSAPSAEDEVFRFPQRIVYERTPLGDAIDAASMKMLKVAYSVAEDKNVIASPLGVLLLLSLFSAGADEGVRDEIVKSLGAANYTELYKSYSRLSEEFSKMDSSYLTLANKVYVADTMELADSFANVARKDYHSDVEKIDFTHPDKAAAIINKWSEEKTQGNIKDPVSADDLSADVAAALFNIIFFKGHWHVPFHAEDTQEKDFFVDRSTVVKKPTMHLQESLFYHENAEWGAKMIELPYKEKGFRMVIILPNEVDGLPSVLDKVSEKGILEDVFKLEPQNSLIDLDLPRFDIKSSLDLNDILPKVGVSRIFNEGATGIVKGAPIVVSKAFQKAFVKVNEEGATAGAFTGTVMVPMASFSRPHIIPFKVDHPFLFAILHEDKLLFTGVYTH